MQRGEVSNVRYYALNCGETLPTWIAPEKRHAVKKDKDLQRKIDLILDYDMPDLSTGVKMTANGEHIVVTGVYKPRVKCFDTSNLSIKFDRCMDAEVIKFQIASTNYEKLIFLQEDRYIELHNKPGRLDRFRIPFFGRDICIDPGSAMLYCVGNRPEIVRFSLDLGQFLPSLPSQASEINTCTYNERFYYTAVGTLDGTVEAWDPRARSKIAKFDLSYGSLRLPKGNLPSVTSLEFNSTGLSMAIGTQTGHILVYDIRGGKPLNTISNFSRPVIKTSFHRDWLLTLDTTALQLWPQEALHHTDVAPYLSLRSDTLLTDFCAVKDSGLLFLTGETKPIKTFYVPTVGPSPRWCHYLDGLINELEESTDEVVYDQYKFVTEEDLAKLQATHLIGTNLLLAQSHGFYINLGLYYRMKMDVDHKDPKKDKRNLIKEKITQMRTDLKDPKPTESNHQQQGEEEPAEPVKDSRNTEYLDIFQDRLSRLSSFKNQHLEEAAPVPRVESKENKIRKKKYKGKKKPTKGK